MDKSTKPRRDDDKRPRKRKESDSKPKSARSNERAGKPFKVRSTSDYKEPSKGASSKGNFDIFKKDRKTTESRGDGERRERKPYADKTFKSRGDSERGSKPYSSDSRDKKPFGDKPYRAKREDGYAARAPKPYSSDRADKKPYGDKPYKPRREEGRGDSERGSRPYSTDRRDKKPFEAKPFNSRREESGDSITEAQGNRDLNPKPFTDRPFRGKRDSERPDTRRSAKPYSSDRAEKKSFGDDTSKEREEKSSGDRKPKREGSYSEYKSRGEKPRSTDRISRTAGDTTRRAEKAEETKPEKSSTYNQKRAERAAHGTINTDEPNEIYEKIEFSGWETYDEKEHVQVVKADKAEDDLSPARPKRPKKLKEEFGDMPYERKALKKAIIPTSPKKREKTFADDGLIRLNRYIANSGVCSRRKADELIENGMVTVNGAVVKELGYKVQPTDAITFNGKLLKREKLVYVLLNKPKDYITTMEDPMERRTVMELVKSTTNERVYPVGRLDRNTTGLLLLTNDGDLADTLSHPRNKVRKLYEVELDKALSPSDFDLVKSGVELEDGVATVDELSYVEGKSKKHIGIEIHIGRNRIVRRIFESLGYTVERLDRVVYAGLTKKDLTRGRCRFLTPEELIHLKHLNKY